MEEQIHKILLDNWKYPTQISAKKITLHILEFIKWKDNDDTFHIYDDAETYVNINTKRLFTLEKVYQYWINNTYTKPTI